MQVQVLGMSLREQSCQVWAREGPDMGSSMGRGVCLGVARSVEPAAAAPEVGLSQGTATPSFPVISQEWGTPPQPQPGAVGSEAGCIHTTLSISIT